MKTKINLEIIKLNLNISNDEKEAIELLYESPEKFDVSLVMQLQSIFLNVSIQRMEQLADEKHLPRLPRSFFNQNNLQNAWFSIRQNYNCSLNEFNKAINFNQLSQLIYERDLQKTEIREITKDFKVLLDIYLSNIDYQHSIKETPVVEIRNEEREHLNSISNNHIPLPEKVANESVKTEKNKSSNFIEQLSKLQISSIEAVVHEKEFTQLQRYMHVDRQIQDELIKALSKNRNEAKPKLILLCGSVGDGKSHLLSYVKEMHGDLLENCFVHNDSTESFNPNEEDIDTLERILAPYDSFEDSNITIVIAINLGVLHKFYIRQKEKGKFQTFCNYIEESGVFSHQTPNYEVKDSFYLLNFAGLQPYKITEEGAESPFFKEVIQKITKESNENPFYNAWKNDLEIGYTSAAHENYKLLQDELIQDSLIQKLIEAMISEKLFLSTRALYNLIYDIIVPLNLNDIVHPNQTLPYMLFNRPDRSSLMQALYDNDPISQRDEKIDSILSSFILSSEPLVYLEKLFGNQYYYSSIWKGYSTAKDSDESDYLKFLVRTFALINKTNQDTVYHSFLNLLYAFYKGDDNKLSELFEMLDLIMEQWIGTPSDGYLYMESNNSNYRIAVKFEGEPEVDEKLYGSRNESEIQHFIPEIRIGYKIGNQSVLVSIDYKLYKLLYKVANGYCPNQQDYTEALQFTDFYSQIIKHSNQSKELLIVNSVTDETLKITKPRFSKKDYEVEVY